MVAIPAGSCLIGDPSRLHPAEIPVHEVKLGAFQMDRYEVTGSLWRDVFEWAKIRGYEFDHRGESKGPQHPIHRVSWFDLLKWCNARSEKETLTPVYYADESQAVVYRKGQIDLDQSAVKWGANGYRLPTEAEWEKAARGGLSSATYPWGEGITPARANYFSTPTPRSGKGRPGYHPDFRDGRPPYTSPVGSFPANGYGLYDMAGNVWEWCWDRYDAGWYADSRASKPDPRGPVVGRFRVMRGGAWNNKPHTLRCAYRDFNAPFAAPLLDGFRCVRIPNEPQ